MVDHGLDWQRVAISTVVTAALAVGLAAAFLHHASSTPDVGPTAGALEDGFSTIFGACLGLLLGSVFAALSVRRGSNLLAGCVAGVAAYWAAFAPYLVWVGASDLTASDYFFGLLFFFVLASGFIVVGALAGMALSSAVGAKKSSAAISRPK